jgi:hypothetical protein
MPTTLILQSHASLIALHLSQADPAAEVPVAISLSQAELAAFIDCIQLHVLTSLHSQGLLVQVPNVANRGLCKGNLESVTRLVREFLNELLLLSMYMRLTW